MWWWVEARDRRCGVGYPLRSVARTRLRVTGKAMIAIGLSIPRAVDWYGNRHALDIRCDIGVLSWLVMTVVGVVLVVVSFKTRE